MKNKTKRKNNKKSKLFRKYTSKSYITKSQFTRMLKNEFHIVYNQHIMNSCMELWGIKINKSKVITKDTFINKLFTKPDGFLRNIIL